MADKNLELTPSDLAGALHRAAVELAQYLHGSHALSLDAGQMKAHIARMYRFLDALEGMQTELRAQHAAANGNGVEQPAN